MKTKIKFRLMRRILALLVILLSASLVTSLRMRVVEDADIVIKFTDRPDLEDTMQKLSSKMQIRMKFLKNKANNGTNFDSVAYFENSTLLKMNDSLIKIDYTPDEGKYIETKRILKFYISLDKGCHVDVNDTIEYESNSFKSPIEHIVTNDIENHGYKISPKGVYSDDMDVQYFGFSQSIKTFSTYFTNKTDAISKSPSTNNLTTLEYIYTAKNLIRSFSDFRDEASYENITYNYNMLSWYLRNENDNFEDVRIKLEYYFDIGSAFADETTNFTVPMKKKVFQYASHGKNKTIVKFSTLNDLVLKYNESLYAQAKLPLYFENCKNYQLNFLVLLTGFFFVAFFGFVAYRSIMIIFNNDDNNKD